MKRKVYQEIAALLTAIGNCEENGNREWLERHRTRLDAICRKFLPTGAGIDKGTKLSDKSAPNRLVFTFGYHHHGDHGYTGWSDYTATITPDLAHGIDLRITGSNKNGVKDYLTDTFLEALRREIDTEKEYAKL